MTLRPEGVRAALIGYGPAGEVFHAPLLATTPGIRLAAIVTRHPERSRRAAASHPGARIVPDATELWAAASDFDLVVVATPNRTHVPLAEQALEAGLAVVVDKPLAVTAAEGGRLIERARRRDLLLTVFQNRRWDGDFLTVRRLVHERACGTVTRFESRFDRWRPVPRPGWRQLADPEEAGGLLYDLGSHLIDQALLLFGPARDVYCEMDRRGPDVRVDDDSFVALTHRSGVRSHLWMSVLAAQPGARFRVLGMSAAYVKYGLDGQEAALAAGRLPTDPGWGEEDEAAWGMLGTEGERRSIPTQPGAYPEFYRAVVRSMREGVPPPVDPADAVATLQVIAAARRSAEEGRVVPL